MKYLRCSIGLGGWLLLICHDDMHLQIELLVVNGVLRWGMEVDLFSFIFLPVRFWISEFGKQEGIFGLEVIIVSWLIKDIRFLRVHEHRLSSVGEVHIDWCVMDCDVSYFNDLTSIVIEHGRGITPIVDIDGWSLSLGWNSARSWIFYHTLSRCPITSLLQIIITRPITKQSHVWTG